MCDVKDPEVSAYIWLHKNGLVDEDGTWFERWGWLSVLVLGLVSAVIIITLGIFACAH